MTAARRVVVLRALGLGDLLTAVPALRGIRAAHPGARITLAAPAVLTPLALLTGAVDEVVDTGSLAALGADLRTADLGVNLHGHGPQSTRVLLDSGARRLVAFAHPDVPECSGPVWRADEHEVRRWCRLVGSAGMPADPADLDLDRPDRRSPAPGAVVVHPGAASGSRRWPPRRWAEVAVELAADGHRVVLTGSSAEVALVRAVAERAGLPAHAALAGRTDLLDLAAVIATARCVLSGDTGVAHLATALRTPSVVLFGPTPPALWGPPGDRPWHRVLWAGRTGDPLADEPDPGLLGIGASDVVAATRRLLADTKNIK